METPDLYALIKSLEYGNNLHIGVVFLENNINVKCHLPHEHTIHSAQVCNFLKNIPGEFQRCLHCRKSRIQRAENEKKPFWTYCINNILEFTAPIIMSGKTVGVIFVGNILTEEGKKNLKAKHSVPESIFTSMETAVTSETVESIAGIVASYILMLLEKFPEEKSNSKTIIQNIKNYISANLGLDLKLSDIAELFFYKEVYLGRLFKSEVGKSFNDYINSQRIKSACSLLTTPLSIIEISEQIGYNSVTYFNRVFKKYTGLTPTEYRSTVI